MGEPQPGDCPECGRPATQHRPAELTEHATAWLADPDRDPTDLLTWLQGLLTGIRTDASRGTDGWLIAANLNHQLGMIAEARRRRDQVAAAAATRQKGTSP